MEKPKIKIDNKLYGYIFHFNHMTGKWAAIPRGKERDYFNNLNGRINTGILYSENIDTLLKFLKKEE